MGLAQSPCVAEESVQGDGRNVGEAERDAEESEDAGPQFDWSVHLQYGLPRHDDAEVPAPDHDERAGRDGHMRSSRIDGERRRQRRESDHDRSLATPSAAQFRNDMQTIFMK